MKKVSVLCVAFLLFTGFSIAQEQYGNIRGIVTDEEGNPLPGVTVILESELYNPRSVLTTEGGIFRFLNVSVGLCWVKCELSGFRTYKQENIDVRVGGNVDLRIVMELGMLEEEVTVVAVSPVVDMKKTGTALNVTQEMLQEIPSARDPWVILKQVPGVLVGRENVGGSESGQQSIFKGKGGFRYMNMYNMDGVPITDMVSLGTSSRYYDFDSFEEMQIVTSGQDASMQTGGISINFITRRGTNKFQVMGRAFFTNDDLQDDNRTEEVEELGYVGDQINQILDYGLQVGGPIIKDRFWFWLGYGVQDIRRITIGGYPENTKLEGINAKLNFQISRKNRAELAFILHSKNMYGREAGPTRPPETTRDQTGASPFLKFEDEHYFSDNFFLSLTLAAHGGPFQLDPKGGLDVQLGYDLATGIWSGSYIYYKSERPSYNAKLDGNYFLEDVLGGDHEFKFGVDYRLTPVRDKTVYPGDTLKLYWKGAPYLARIFREGVWDCKSDRYSFFFNDTFTRGRLTISLGFRLDREKSVNNEASVRASRVAPDLMPALTVPAVDPGVVWLTFSPRIGFTYDLTGDGKTILRGNLARYGLHSPNWIAGLVLPSVVAYATYFWNDLNGDDVVTTDELYGYPTSYILSFQGFDPWNPTRLESPNAIDKNLKAPLIDEILLGFERELFTDFSLSATFIYRRNIRNIWWPYYDKESDTKVTQADYTEHVTGSLTYEGKTYDYEYWALDQYRPSGRYLENQPDWHENYRGFEIAVMKRFSRRWMMNASFTYQISTKHFGDNGFFDPTNIAKLEGSRLQTLGADWMAKVSFLYQLPWGFSISCFANARQGYVLAQQIRVPSPERAAVGLGGTVDLYIEKPGETRLPGFYNVDLSLLKDFQLGDYGRLSLQVDAFNVFNYAHTLARYQIVNSPRHNEIEKILNPRVIRFGLRYRF